MSEQGQAEMLRDTEYLYFVLHILIRTDLSRTYKMQVSGAALQSRGLPSPPALLACPRRGFLGDPNVSSLKADNDGPSEM